jgi:hypothetical protein
VDAPVWCDSNEAAKILLTFSIRTSVDVHRAVRRLAQPFALSNGHSLKPSSTEYTMNLTRTFCLACCLFALQGCFDNSDNETKDNTDGTKSSVQMQESKSESK